VVCGFCLIFLDVGSFRVGLWAVLSGSGRKSIASSLQRVTLYRK